MADNPLDRAINEEGHTLLHQAVESENIAEIQRLIQAGASTEILDGMGQTPLMLASELGDKDTVAALLAGGANLETRRALPQNSSSEESDIDYEADKYNGRTALLEAIANDQEDIVQLLLDAGAKVDVKSEDGMTALHYAADDYIDGIANKTFDLVLAQRPNLNAKDDQGRTALHILAADGDLEGVKELVAAGADIRVLDEEGNSLLQAAVGSGEMEMVKYFVDSGLDINTKNYAEETLLHSAAQEIDHEMVEYFIDQGLDVNARDNMQQTPLIMAANSFAGGGFFGGARDGKVETVKALIEAGADPMAKDDIGRSPIRASVVSSDLEVLNLLLSEIDDPKKVTEFVNEAGSEGNTILHDVMHEGLSADDLAMVKKLVEVGADVNQLNDLGQSPLDLVGALKTGFSDTGPGPALGFTELGTDPKMKADVFDFLVDKGARPGQEIDGNRINAALERTKDMTIGQMLQDQEAQLVMPSNFSAEERQESFGAVPRLQSSKPEGTRVFGFSIEAGDKMIGDEDGKHIQWTTDTFSGVRQQLSGGESDGRVFGLKDMLTAARRFEMPAIFGGSTASSASIIPDAGMDMPLRLLLRRPEMEDGQIVVNLSWGDFKELKVDELMSTNQQDYAAAQQFYDQFNIVAFRAVGNSGDQLDAQDSPAIFHIKNIASVAAAEKGADGRYIIEGYSNDNPTFSAPLALMASQEEGQEKKVLEGTSFASPYAAAVYSELAENHGISDKNPDGLTYEELMYVMSSTAVRDVDAQVGSSDVAVPVTYRVNGAGLGYSEQAGFGVIDAAAADQLASRLVEMKRELGVETVSQEQSYTIDPAGAGLNQDGTNTYRITVTEDILVQNIHLNLRSDEGSNLEATLQGESITSKVNISPNGSATVHDHMGETIKAGTELIITTSAPLKDGSGIEIRGVNADSVTSVLIEQTREQNLQEVIQINARNAERFNTMLEEQTQRFLAQGFTQPPDITPSRSDLLELAADKNLQLNGISNRDAMLKAGVTYVGELQPRYKEFAMQDGATISYNSELEAPVVFGKDVRSASIQTSDAALRIRPMDEDFNLTQLNVTNRRGANAEKGGLVIEATTEEFNAMSFSRTETGYRIDIPGREEPLIIQSNSEVKLKITDPDPELPRELAQVARPLDDVIRNLERSSAGLELSAMDKAAIESNYISSVQESYSQIMEVMVLANEEGHGALSQARGKLLDDLYNNLVEAGLDPAKARDSEGNTPLHFAIATGNVEVVRDMLAAGVDINAVNKADETVLDIVNQIIEDQPDAAQLMLPIKNFLLENGAITNKAPEVPEENKTTAVDPLLDAVASIAESMTGIGFSDPNALKTPAPISRDVSERDDGAVIS